MDYMEEDLKFNYAEKIVFFIFLIILGGVGAYFYLGDRPVGVEKIVKKVIECKNWGGDFKFEETSNWYPAFSGLRAEEKDTTTCTKTYTEGDKKITETLFDYKFDYKF